MESITLIDVSSENDLLISSPSEGLLKNIEGPSYFNSGSGKLNARADSQEMSEEKLQVPELSTSPKQKRASSKCNLRKSLAWDNAFFTNEGVLNHEELAIVNSTFKKAEADKLPSIEEDLRNSMESSTTLDGDVWELENLEVDLFENLRASIQRSVGKFGKASGVVPSTKPTHLGRAATSQHQSSNMPEISSHFKMKPPIACKRIVNSKQSAANTSKVTLQPMQVVTAGQNDPKPSIKPSIKPPRSAPRATTVPTLPNKKVSTSVMTQMGSESSKHLPGNVLNRQSLVAKKIPGDLCSTSSSGALGKYPLKIARKKGNTPDCLSSTTPKSPLKTSRTKIESRNAIKPPAMPKSRLRVSSAVSPQSSVDSWTSESSLSASTFIKHSHSPGSPDADSSSSSSSSPSFKVTFDFGAILPLEPQKPAIDKPYITKEITGTIPQSQIPTEEPAKTQVSVKSFTGDNSLRNTRRSSEVNNAKPSGLRLPTPKIGYFDPGKSLLPNPSRYSLNATRKHLPKNSSLDRNAVGPRKLDSGICDPTSKDSKPSNQTNKEDACWRESFLLKEADMENDLEHSPMRCSGKENFSSQDQDAVKVRSELLEQKLSSLSLLDEKDLNINLDLVSSST